MEQWTKEVFYKNLNSGNKGAFYLYTPMCGTCQVAGKMLEVIHEVLPDFPVGKADLNYNPDLADEFFIESVPCLLIYNNGEIQDKIYAFQSVPYLYEKLKA